MQPSIVINKTKSEISIRDFYHIGDDGNGGDGGSTGYYGSVFHKVKPHAYKFIYPSYFERLSKDLFRPLEIRICREDESQFIPFSPLEFEVYDGIVIHVDDNDSDKLAVKFVKRGKVYAHQWLKYWIPDLGVKRRIEYILSVPSSESAAKPVPG